MSDQIDLAEHRDVTVAAAIIDTAKPEWLEDMKVLNLRLGDVVVLRHPGCLTQEAIAHIRAAGEKAFAPAKVVVLECGMDIGVVRQEGA